MLPRISAWHVSRLDQVEGRGRLDDDLGDPSEPRYFCPKVYRRHGKAYRKDGGGVSAWSFIGPFVVCQSAVARQTVGRRIARSAKREPSA